MIGTPIDRSANPPRVEGGTEKAPAGIRLSLEELSIRPIRPDDKFRLQEFFGSWGLCRLLFLHLVQTAWARGVRTVELLISADNTKMLNMVKHFGHVISRIPEAGAYHIRCSLDNPGDSLWEH